MKFTFKAFQEMYPTDEVCLDTLFKMRFGQLECCPDCAAVTTFHRVKKRRCYECKHCGYQIYPTAGTVFEKTRTSLTKWFHAIYLMSSTRNGVAATEIERHLGCTYKTAWRMMHQIRLLMANKETGMLTGVIEMDESFIGGLNKNRHADKKVEDSQGRSCKDKTPVFGMLKRGGGLSVHVVDDTKGTTLKPLIEKHVIKDASVLITDEWLGYKGLDKTYSHVVINHSEKEFVRGAFDTNSIEGFWSQLKRTIKGTHIQVSKKHLQKYADEVAFRYENRANKDQMFNLILENVKVSQPVSKEIGNPQSDSGSLLPF